MLFVGCNQNNSESSPRSEKQPPDNTIEQSSYQQEHTLTNEQIASHLAKVASEVPNVHDATAVVVGPYAVVGIDIDDMAERSRVGTIKYSVNEALEHDPYGRTAVVIADADMMTRLKEMRQQLQEGKPIQGIVDELATIVSRYMPAFPKEDTNKNELEPDTKQNQPEPNYDNQRETNPQK